MSVFRQIWISVVDSFLVHTLRSSMLVGGVAVMVAGTGAWQYLASSLNAHDVKRAVAWHKGDVGAPVVVVAINDAGYERFFGARSPLHRGRVQHLLDTIHTNVPNAKRIAVDIDLSPSVGQESWQDSLDTFLKASPQKWVLPAIAAPEGSIDTTIWRKALCTEGVGFAHPFVPTEFGYPKLTHQYKDSFAQAMLGAGLTCADPSHPLHQTPLVLSPVTLQSAVMLPFDGDLAALAAMLKMLNPAYVLVGGTWGSTDIFATPFGDRFGVQVHAAALSGLMDGHYQVPYWLQLLVGWAFVGFVTAFATYTIPRIQTLTSAGELPLPGHAFFINVVLPVCFVLVVGGALLGVSEMLAALRARTGVWIPSAMLATNVLVYMMVVWTWGKTAVRHHISPGQAWQKLFVLPLRADLASINSCWLALTSKHPTGPTTKLKLRQLLWELAMAVASLLMQTVIPTIAFTYAFSKPL